MSSNQYNILRVDASANVAAATSRKLGDQFIARLKDQQTQLNVIDRDLSNALPQLDQSWLNAYFSDAAEASAEQLEALKQSDSLVEELLSADELLITTPMYNFTVPSSLKAWIDLICRAGMTFAYTENGPRGLLENKKATLIISTGGVPVQSPADFLTDYLVHILGFIGITDVTVIAADKMNVDGEASYAAAAEKIDQRFSDMQLAS